MKLFFSFFFGGDNTCSLLQLGFCLKQFFNRQPCVHISSGLQRTRDTQMTEKHVSLELCTKDPSKRKKLTQFLEALALFPVHQPRMHEEPAYVGMKSCEQSWISLPLE